MSPTLKSLRALSDATRLRIVALLERDELSVNELQEITRMGQSRISTHLGLLADCELVKSRREGKRTFYRLNPDAEGTTAEFIQLAIKGAKELQRSGQRPDQSQARPESPPRAGGSFLQPSRRTL
jgi:DNA-binding transcriptional ArsR family regulator